ncbi:MAG: hypothetical protein B7733_22130 [Myxococcales bacterium FL481]|nr:MAG: hypothetical protein B7733_22130 [Myxococcales bacterium FL481]
MALPPVSVHEFFIPVMGIGFTIDTPLRVAPLGIDSAVSLVNDRLIEHMRAVHAAEHGSPYRPIASEDHDARARRIRTYLDVLQDLIDRRVAAVRNSAFVPESPITRYFELLPPGELRTAYEEMLIERAPAERARMQASLRSRLRAGNLDANIMTKLDNALKPDGTPRPDGESDAIAAFRGYADSRARGRLILSAGLNPRLIAAMAGHPAFTVDLEGNCPKSLVVKVSDYRSAAIQGKYLAKRGLWPAEFRVESGLNCGGHAFGAQGRLLGPVLAEFRRKREALHASLFDQLRTALRERGAVVPRRAPSLRVSAQGGVGRASEARLLREQYGVDAVGWGTPFLLVPEVTRVDERTLRDLERAREADVVLSRSSPLGVRFWTLRDSTSERAKRARVADGRPGSRCPNAHLAIERDDRGRPTCRASRRFQRNALTALRARARAQAREVRADELETILSPACICDDLCASAYLVTASDRSDLTPAVCPGPNIAYYNQRCSLDQLVDHIYGRGRLEMRGDRPHMLVQEAELNLRDLCEQFGVLRDLGDSVAPRGAHPQLRRGIENLREGLLSYRSLNDSRLQPELSRLLEELQYLQVQLDQM